MSERQRPDECRMSRAERVTYCGIDRISRESRVGPFVSISTDTTLRPFAPAWISV
ncbi:MAG: hypothetical protein ACOCY0_03205 [Roseicyclus sp.]